LVNTFKRETQKKAQYYLITLIRIEEETEGNRKSNEKKLYNEGSFFGKAQK
jgi:hypothetical protein